MTIGRKGLSLFCRLLAAFLAVVIVIGGILTAAFYAFYRNSLEKQAREQILGGLAAIHRSFVHNLGDDVARDLRLLASNPKLDEFITSSEIEKDIILLSVERLFMKFVANESSYRSIRFVDATGMETIKVDRTRPVRFRTNIKDDPLFQRIESGSSDRFYVGKVSPRGPGRASFTIGIYKTDDDIGLFGGAVMIDVDLDPFFRYLEGITIFGENCVWVFGPDGKILDKPRNQAVTFDPSRYFGHGYRESAELMAVEEGILAYQDFSLAPGEPFLRLAVSIPSALMLKDTRTTANLFALIFLVSILLAFAISLYLSRYLSRPIRELAVASGRLADGDLSTRVDVRTTGEVRMLVDGFNRMAEDLQATTVSKDYVDNIIHSLADSLIVLNRDMTIKTVNQALLELLGYREDELLGNRFETVVAGGPASTRDEIRGGGPVRNGEMAFRAKDGKLIPVLVTASVIANKKAEIIGHVVVSKDITGRKQAEEALREANDRLNATLQASPAAIMTLNLEGNVTMWNEAAERIFGWTRAEIIGCLNPLVTTDRSDHFQRLRERVRGGGTFYDVEIRRKKRDGSPVDISLSTAPLHDANGSVVGVMAVMNDITERKVIDGELSKIQKLDSIGLLAGGIAHDFNNILTIILGYISLAKESVDPGNRIAERLVEAEKACVRAKDLTHQLLTFSRGGSPVKKAISISETIRESASFALRGSKVRCEFELAGNLRAVDADEGQISQVIQNLVINANQAMPAGGTIRIGAGNASLDERSGVPLAEGRYVKVVIEDQGTGIATEHLPKIFDPYFTTKQKGSGLGLAIVYSIVKSHGGYVRVDSTKGVGTTVTLYLPESDRPLAEANPPDGGLVPGKGRVLLMDDEEMVRAAVGAMLTATGYEVEYAKDGEEAVDLYRKALGSESPFSMVIMDLTIPGGMGGQEAINKLREIDPHVNAIVSSGYSDDPVMANFRDYGFSAVIAKPFRLSDLSRTLHLTKLKS